MEPKPPATANPVRRVVLHHEPILSGLVGSDAYLKAKADYGTERRHLASRLQKYLFDEAKSDCFQWNVEWNAPREKYELSTGCGSDRQYANPHLVLSATNDALISRYRIDLRLPNHLGWNTVSGRRISFDSSDFLQFAYDLAMAAHTAGRDPSSAKQVVQLTMEQCEKLGLVDYIAGCYADGMRSWCDSSAAEKIEAKRVVAPGEPTRLELTLPCTQRPTRIR